MISFRKIYTESIQDLTVKKTLLTDSKVQEILSKYIDDLPLFQQMVRKGTSKTNRNIELYYDNDEFIGYYIFDKNIFAFDKNKKPIEGEDTPSEFNTLHILDIEVRESIRRDKSRERYGKTIINNIIKNAKGKYDGITLQANNDYLLNTLYPSYGFVDLNFGGNLMVLWL